MKKKECFFDGFVDYTEESDADVASILKDLHEMQDERKNVAKGENFPPSEELEVATDENPVSAHPAKREKSVRKTAPEKDVYVIRVALPKSLYWELKTLKMRDGKSAGSLLVEAIELLPSGKRDTKNFVSRQILESFDKRVSLSIPVKLYIKLKMFASENKLSIPFVVTVILADYLGVPLPAKSDCTKTRV